MTSQIIKTYTLKDFKIIEQSGLTYAIPPDIQTLINTIATEVGAPAYIKTPSFARRTNSQRHEPLNNNKRKNKTPRELSNAEWENLMVFQTTVKKEHSGIDIIIDEVRIILNKLTDETYDIMFPKLKEQINTLHAEADIQQIAKEIFSIASDNMFYSKVYTRLYAELVDIYDFYLDILNDHMSQYLIEYKNIVHIQSSEDNYVEFCKNNDNNRKRKALGVFFVNASFHYLINRYKICDLIRNIQLHMISLLQVSSSSEIIEELSDLLFVMITKCDEEYDNLPLWHEITEDIKKISKMNIKDNASLTHKTRFKHMDILDHRF